MIRYTLHCPHINTSKSMSSEKMIPKFVLDSQEEFIISQNFWNLLDTNGYTKVKGHSWILGEIFCLVYMGGTHLHFLIQYSVFIREK